ncbi:hypothetical protein QBC35DRAFT_445260 [Podospora australis]|uniref:RBR-type E3 ubiquitin transferase n=1 Tax=Podospora australis TaxID=1536484 RepID=A0AAN6WIC4_9PEZI|nr:hypothetical protein QBC35DRAFT_445260 [Podospora australis]
MAAVKSLNASQRPTTPTTAHTSATAPSPISVPEEKRQCHGCSRQLAVSRNFPARPFTPGCRHPRVDTCLDCVLKHIRVSVIPGPSPSLQPPRQPSVDVRCTESCPPESCPEIIPYERIQLYADAEVKNVYDELLTRKLLEQDENFIWCAHGCGQGQIHEGGKAQPIVTCTNCNKKTCFNHRGPWHEGIPCEEYGKTAAFSFGSSSARTYAKTKVEGYCNKLRERSRVATAAVKTHLDKSFLLTVSVAKVKSCPKCERDIDTKPGL